MNNLLVIMSITGSIPLLLYCLLKKLSFYQSVSKSYMLLLLSVTFFIIPFPLLSRELRILFFRFFHVSDRIWAYSLYNAPIFSVNDTIVLWKNPNPGKYVALIWLIISIVFLSINIKNYFLLRKKIKDSCEYESREIVSFGILKRTVLIYVSSIYNIPFSTGFFHPVIVLPNNLSQKERTLAILHEKVHIQRLDFLICFFVIIIRSFHWFNPLCYILPGLLKTNQEYLTDIAVMRKLSPQQQHDYGQLILESTGWDKFSFKYDTYISSLHDKEYNILRERIIRIKNIMKNKKPKSFFVIVAIIISLTTNIIFPVMAYSLPVQIVGDFTPTGGTFRFIPDSLAEDVENFDLSNIYFVSDSGERYPVLKNSLTNNTRSSCKHNWESGKLEKHIPHSDRSCDVMVYNAKRCSLCGYIESTELINVIHYKVCPH